jgi:hypothetical protein
VKLRDIAIGIVLLVAGYWIGQHSTTRTALPTAKHGTVGQVSRDGSTFTFTPSGGSSTDSYALETASWRDATGSWHAGSRPACMSPLSHGQQVTIGLVSSSSVDGAPAGTTVAWIECT